MIGAYFMHKPNIGQEGACASDFKKKLCKSLPSTNYALCIKFIQHPIFAIIYPLKEMQVSFKPPALSFLLTQIIPPPGEGFDIFLWLPFLHGYVSLIYLHLKPFSPAWQEMG